MAYGDRLLHLEEWRALHSHSSDNFTTVRMQLEYELYSNTYCQNKQAEEIARNLPSDKELFAHYTACIRDLRVALAALYKNELCG